VGVAAVRWSLLLGTILLAYPLLVYLGLSYFEPRIVALMIVLLAIARFALALGAGTASFMPQLLLALAAALGIGFLSLVSNSAAYLRFYPVCMNALMFALFFVGLLRPPSMIERFARITEPDLPERGVRYTRQVTKLWCGFFVVNGSIALYSSLAGSLEFWTLYNGGIAYLLMAVLFGGEYLFRIWWRRQARGQ
jgi:uncharacterized membrane protein